MLGTTRPCGVAMATPMFTWRWHATEPWSADRLALRKGQSRSARPAACERKEVDGAIIAGRTQVPDRLAMKKGQSRSARPAACGGKTADLETHSEGAGCQEGWR